MGSALVRNPRALSHCLGQGPCGFKSCLVFRELLGGAPPYWVAPRAKAAPSRGKARNRRLAHVVRTRNVGLRFPISKPRKGFLTLMTVEGRLAAETHALGLRTGSAVAGAGENRRSLELRQGRVIAERGLTRCPGRSSISTIRVRKHEGGLFLIAVKGTVPPRGVRGRLGNPAVRGVWF